MGSSRYGSVSFLCLQKAIANVLQYQVVETEEKHPASNAETKRLNSGSAGHGTSVQPTEVPSTCILCMC
jgi:hypothetical protein